MYELPSDDPHSMHYKMKDKFYLKTDCFLLILCSDHLILCLVSTISTSGCGGGSCSCSGSGGGVGGSTCSRGSSGGSGNGSGCSSSSSVRSR